MGKIAVELERALARRAANGAAGRATGRMLARGDGWVAEDVICTSGPEDRPFEELHSQVSIAIVVAGTFQYRSPEGRELMTPGSLLLGNPGQCFECGHEHGTGDRCVAFRFAPEHFQQVAADAGASPAQRQFGLPRLPPLRGLSPVVARACGALTGDVDTPWEEVGVQLAADVVRVAGGLGDDRYFLRTFERVTGVTPHQYVLRARLREAAVRLTAERERIIEIALGCGFDDVSNFNRAFRSEFGVNPRAYRERSA